MDSDQHSGEVGLVEPLPDLPAWTDYFLAAEIPVLRSTAETLEALRVNEDMTDANSIGQMIAGDPMMTLKVLAHASRLRTERVVTPPETVTAALVMMGISPFFRAFPPQPTIEERLAGSPAALAGLLRVVRRAHRSADFALAFSIHRTDPNAASIHAAALLHEFVEMLMWLHAPRLALRIQSAQDSDATLRSQAAQQAVLGIDCMALQAVLVSTWGLPALLQQLRTTGPGNAAGYRTVLLAADLARHSAAGWDNAALADDFAHAGELLNMSPDAVMELARAVDSM